MDLNFAARVIKEPCADHVTIKGTTAGRQSMAKQSDTILRCLLDVLYRPQDGVAKPDLDSTLSKETLGFAWLHPKMSGMIALADIA